MAYFSFIRKNGRIIPIKKMQEHDKKSKAGMAAAGASIGVGYQGLHSAIVQVAKGNKSLALSRLKLFGATAALSIGASAYSGYHGAKRDKSNVAKGKIGKAVLDNAIDTAIFAGAGVGTFYGLKHTANLATKLSGAFRSLRAKVVNPEAAKTASSVVRKSATVKSSKVNFSRLLGSNKTGL